MDRPVPGAAAANHSDQLRRRLDELELELLAALDAAQGAEAERAVVEARVRDLEHQHHMLVVEREHLRGEIERLTAGPLSRGAREVERIHRSVRRKVSGGGG